MKYKDMIFQTLVLCLAPLLTNAQVYKNADLPNAMTFLNGQKVRTIADFQERKKEIKDLWCEYYIGHYPDEVPALLSAELINEKKGENGSLRKRIQLIFDTPHKKSFEIEVWIPANGSGSFPLLLTQPRYYQIPWADEALKRGYVVCLYPGLDYNHEEKDYPDYQNVWRSFKTEYPNAGWSSSLGIQAWLASRTLDYLLNPEYGYNIDTTAVGIIGHSRYGKQSVYAAAFDERFKCVVARSSGTPTACPYRFASRQTFMESSSDEDCPGEWVLPGLSDYLGRENELPVEGNDLLATIAPRYLMIHTAYNDGSDPSFGVERSYLNAKKAYTFLNKQKNIRLVYRKGGHNPITAEHIKINLDFFDRAFGREKVDESEFQEKLLHQFDWQAWKNAQDEVDLKVPKNALALEKIEWVLGRRSEKIEHEGEYHIPADGELGVDKWSRDRWNPGGLKRVPFSFSGNMTGNIYFDPKLKRYKATVIWLHPWNYSHGSNEGYGVQGTTIYWRLAQEGYIVVAYDQFGFGDHLLNAVDFYRKHPHWSKLGRAIYDVQKVVDFLIDGKGVTSEAIPKTDPSRIYICGFAYGGMVGLYATAFDKRIAGVASFSGFTPMRTDTNQKPTGGLQQYYQWHAILPKLGLFNRKEKKIPYDYDDIIKLIAPRNCLIYSPLMDRFTNPKDIAECIEKAKEAWNKKEAFDFITLDDICRFQKDQQDVVLEWLNSIVK
jgi:pimeloyl-ACP methyl ester carboxylesterase